MKREEKLQRGPLRFLLFDVVQRRNVHPTVGNIHADVLCCGWDSVPH